jgi:Zn-dependent protease with chaperone function
MGDSGKGLGVAGSQLDTFGRALIEWFGLLNFWTAVLLAGALVLDRMLTRRARASLRIALYAPIALRIVLPLDWTIGLASGPRLGTLVAPLLQIETASTDPTAGHGASWYALAAVLYAAVAALLALRAIYAHVRLRRALAATRPIVDLRIGVSCPIVQHEDLGPMAVGLLAPRVVLPRRLLVAGDDALACVLRHEAAHLRRGDAWLSAGMQLLTVAAWPVGPLWIAVARVRQLMELACDDAALAGADANERRRYGHTLLDIAEWRFPGTAPLGAGELHFGSTLRARIEALASQHHWSMTAQVLTLFCASTALFIACSGGGSLPAAAERPLDPFFEAHAGRYGYEFKTVTAAEVSQPPAPLSDALLPGLGGRLAPESIENVVRASFGEISACYEQGRRRDPHLKGLITIKCVIGEDGMTKGVSDDGSTLRDQEVLECVVAVFQRLRYGSSHDGNVNVVYPIQLGS